MEHKCSLCGAFLRQNNLGTLCSPCQEKRRERVENISPYYTVKELTHVLGLESEESVKRLGRQGKIPGRIPQIKKHLYLKEAVDEWIRSDNVRIRNPAILMQSEANELCLQYNHDWMDDDRFVGRGCMIEILIEIVDNRVVTTLKKTCYFCGYVKFSPFP